MSDWIWSKLFIYINFVTSNVSIILGFLYRSNYFQKVKMQQNEWNKNWFFRKFKIEINALRIGFILPISSTKPHSNYSEFSPERSSYLKKWQVLKGVDGKTDQIYVRGHVYLWSFILATISECVCVCVSLYECVRFNSTNYDEKLLGSGLTTHSSAFVHIEWLI